MEPEVVYFRLAEDEQMEADPHQGEEAAQAAQDQCVQLQAPSASVETDTVADIFYFLYQETSITGSI